MWIHRDLAVTWAIVLSPITTFGDSGSVILNDDHTAGQRVNAISVLRRCQHASLKNVRKEASLVDFCEGKVYLSA